MKTKVIVFGLCALMSACGLNKRGTEAVRETTKAEESTQAPITGTLLLSNQNLNQSKKIQSFQSGSEYLILGTFDPADVPVAISALPSETEIGTLTVEFDEETYSSRYEDDVRPVLKKQQREIKTTVLILKEKFNPEQIHFVIKNDEAAKSVRASEEAITVHSSPKEYCYRARFFIKQIVDKVAILDQIVTCNASGICAISVRYDSPRTQDVAATYDMNANPQRLPIQCLEMQTHYSMEQEQMNRSIPTAATVTVFEKISKELKLVFEL